MALLVIVLILSMLPTANVFRWSFRWLPLVHLVLVLCAAESLRLFGDRMTPPARLAVLTSSALIAFVSLLATYLWIPPNCGVPKYNLAQALNESAPLDPHRLYLSVYPAPEEFYRVEKKSGPVGTTLRLGSTSMFGGIRLINGYSPIRPAGVAREFATAIHGEIRSDVANSLLEQQSGPDGILARLGVDGILVASEAGTDPQPETEWELAVTTKEGRVFNRRGGVFPVVRSLSAIDSRPNEQFAPAEISRIDNGRNRLEAEVAVPPGDKPALLAISRPYFNGYRARIEGRELRVDSYRGLIPTIEIPPGINGRLLVVYRPPCLVWGAVISISCLAVLVVSGVFAVSQTRRFTS